VSTNKQKYTTPHIQLLQFTVFITNLYKINAVTREKTEYVITETF